MADPTVPVAPPRRRPRKGGIRSVAHLESFERAFAADSLDWEAVACAPVVDAPGLCWGNPVADGEKTYVGIDNFDSSPIFPIYAGVECYLNAGETFEAEAREVLELGADIAIEFKLWAYLNDLAGGSPLSAASLAEAVARADEDADIDYAGMPVIYLARADVVRLVASGHLIAEDGGTGRVWTANGTPVVSSGAFVPGIVLASGDLTLYESAIVATTAPAPGTNRGMAIAEKAFAFGVACGYVMTYQVTTP